MDPMLLYVIGVTCSGKGYFIESTMREHSELFAAVQVGKEFRRRYPPDYFQGSGAPAHAEQEAHDIFYEQLDAAKATGKPIILIDGQPRRLSQVQLVRDNPGSVLWFHSDELVVRERLALRFPDDEASRDLSNKRMVNDRMQLYDTLHALRNMGCDIEAVISPDQVPALRHSLVRKAKER